MPLRGPLALRRRVKDLEAGITGHAGYFQSLERRMDGFEISFARQVAALDALSERLDALEDRLIHDFAAAEDRLAALEHPKPKSPSKRVPKA